MQSVDRFCLCYFPFNGDEKANHLYKHKHTLLTELRDRSKDNLLSLVENNSIITTQILYDRNTYTYLSMAGYRFEIFMGFYNRGAKTLKFEDFENGILGFSDFGFSKLESLFLAACHHYNIKKHDSKTNSVITDIENIWIATTPLLDKYISLQKTIDSLEKDSTDRCILENSRSDKINQMIDDYYEEIHQENLNKNDGPDFP